MSALQLRPSDDVIATCWRNAYPTKAANVPYTFAYSLVTEIEQQLAQRLALQEDLLAELRTLGRPPCVGTDGNNDTCGVTFTCWACQQNLRIAALLAKAEPGPCTGQEQQR